MSDCAKIALVMPYFGKFKNYFPLFLISCKNNSSIDWIVYTDSDESYDWPENVKYIKMSFEDFRKKVQQNFDFEIELSSPYKLCDYKPAYGEICKNELVGYDFWGYCDCDLIFGDIRKFVTPIITNNYSKMFSRGHLSIYRNTQEVNSFYRNMKILDYKKVYTKANNYAIDEWGGISREWERAQKPCYDELLYDDIRTFTKGFRPTKEVEKGAYSPYHKGQINFSRRYRCMHYIVYQYKNKKLFRYWLQNGKINKEEILYVHLQKRTMTVENYDKIKKENGEFIIIPNKFIPITDINCNSIKKLTNKNHTLRDRYIILKLEASIKVRKLLAAIKN